MNDYYTNEMIHKILADFQNPITDYTPLGNILFIEYGEGEDETPRYTTYIDGIATDKQYDSIDYALADTIANKHGISDTATAAEFMRMIKERD